MGKPKINQGSDLLLPKEQWTAAENIQGDEIKTLQSPVIEAAFQRILQLHKPRHKIALVSLCTSTRPYSKSRKWKKFIELFGDSADMIICSNGGIIPIEFESCYPYMTYDAHGEGKWDRQYINTCYRRLNEFFDKFHYEKIVFNFRPNMRNRLAALAFQRDYKGSSKIVIVPTAAAYREAQRDGFKPAGMRFPDLSYPVLNELRKEIEK